MVRTREFVERWETAQNTHKANYTISTMQYNDAKSLLTGDKSWCKLVPGRFLLTKHNWMPLELPLKNFNKFYAHNRLIGVHSTNTKTLVAFAIVATFATAMRCLTTMYCHGSTDLDVFHQLFVFVLQDVSNRCDPHQTFALNIMLPSVADLVAFGKCLGAGACNEPHLACAVGESFNMC
jgi:hypothetical protein